jgi:hypothetical protein
MLQFVDTQRMYPFETVAVMTAAFDTVCQSHPTLINGNEDMRKSLALIILRHVDLGERDALRLADIAGCELAGADRSGRGMNVRSE